MVLKLTKSQFKTLLQSNKQFVLVDALSRERFAREHIPGSYSLPLNEIERTAADLLSKDDLIVVYDDGISSNVSELAAQKLNLLGFMHVISFPGGLEDYKDIHLPLEGVLHSSFTGS